MAKMYFSKSVKYKGTVHAPKTIFEVLDNEVEDLKVSGGVLVEEKSTKKEEVTTEPIKQEAPKKKKSTKKE